MTTKPLSKKEIKARKAEENRKVNKKRDFRKFANKFFKNPTDQLPLKVSGLGDGEVAHCYDCGMTTPRVTVKEDRTIICRICGGTNVEFRTKTPTNKEIEEWRIKETKYKFKQKTSNT